MFVVYTAEKQKVFLIIVLVTIRKIEKFLNIFKSFTLPLSFFVKGKLKFG